MTAGTAEAIPPGPAILRERRDVPSEEDQDGRPLAAAREEFVPAGDTFAPPSNRSLVDEPEAGVIVEDGPIVAPNTLSGRTLTTLVAIMTFLVAVTFASAVMIDQAANAWSEQVLDDISVSILPSEAGSLDERTQEVVAILQAQPGLSDVQALSDAQSAALLEPWLGQGADLSLLPVPALVTARRGASFDPDAAIAALGAVPGISLDDHQTWSNRLAGMAGAMTGAAIFGLIMMLCATVIAIVFATRAAIATNASTVSVLSALGAEDRFILKAFRRRFLVVGIRGAAIGWVLATLLFGALELWSMFSAGAASQQAVALLGAPSIGIVGFVGISVLCVATVFLVTFTAGLAVSQHLKTLIAKA